MSEEPTASTWGAFGVSVRGASHQRSGLPNQDSIQWYPRRPGRYGPPLVMVVSDGHGSAKSFRSDVGSEIAAKRTRETVRQLLKSEIVSSHPSIIKRLIDERLPRDLVQNWRKAVDKHISENPFKDDEFARLEKKEGILACKKVQENPYLAYGATLLVVLISKNFIYFLQLGDGDILIVTDNGEVIRPLPKDDRLIANETTSLSQRLAWQEFRSSFIPLADFPPALILLSSDGYSNSFRDEESFLKVGRDFLDLMQNEGSKMVWYNLHNWLHEASQLGSGDDISLGVIYRKDVVQPVDVNNLDAESAEVDNCLDAPLEDNSNDNARSYYA